MPVWAIFFGDLGISALSLWFSYQLRFNFAVPEHELDTYWLVFPVVLGIRALGFLVFQTHRGIIRFTNMQDAQRIFVTVAAGSALLMLLNPILYSIRGIYAVPFSIIIIESFLTIFMMVSARILIMAAYQQFTNDRSETYLSIIYGAGDTGLMAKKAIERDAGTKYRVMYYLDNNPGKIGKKVQGVQVKSSAELSQILAEHPIKLLILAIPTISVSLKQEIIDTCLANNVKVFTVPPIKSWINGELSFKQIKKINVNDLLEREPIKLDTPIISEKIKNKTVLVTGAAGSIGSELVKQILRFEPGLIVLLDNAESALYELERELQDELFVQNFEIVMGDIRNPDRMERVFNHFKPNIVFHAAAYKHVPLMENNPTEALQTNVIGTKILADLAVAHGVERFVMVSTDKAVKPTNVMGASKRIAEMYVQALDKISNTCFVTTRFGNVLGSNGSVIPIIKKQIDRGGPVTVTHPEITRYFMTIPEACQLVLEAGAIGLGGEIFIFDMGKSVKIVDLVRKMIKLSGLTLGKDIEIVYSGLRPGEKLYEELLNDCENTIPTHHPQIMRAKVDQLDYDYINSRIDELAQSAYTHDNKAMVARMKALVPDYISNNSVFEALDEPRR